MKIPRRLAQFSLASLVAILSAPGSANAQEPFDKTTYLNSPNAVQGPSVAGPDDDDKDINKNEGADDDESVKNFWIFSPQMSITYGLNRHTETRTSPGGILSLEDTAHSLSAKFGPRPLRPGDYQGEFSADIDITKNGQAYVKLPDGSNVTGEYNRFRLGLRGNAGIYINLTGSPAGIGTGLDLATKVAADFNHRAIDGYIHAVSTEKITGGDTSLTPIVYIGPRLRLGSDSNGETDFVLEFLAGYGINFDDMAGSNHRVLRYDTNMYLGLGPVVVNARGEYETTIGNSPSNGGTGPSDGRRYLANLEVGFQRGPVQFLLGGSLSDQTFQAPHAVGTNLADKRIYFKFNLLRPGPGK